MSRKRKVYRVQFHSRTSMWRVRGIGRGGGLLCTSKVKAVGEARYEARTAWREDGRLAQVVIYKKNGRIETEHTYGRDPKRYPG